MHRILDKKKSLIICENNYKLAEILDFLERNSKENFFIFKEFETLPYDHFSPHMDNLSNRIETLSKSSNAEITLVTTTNALIQPLFDKTSINNFSYSFELSDQIDRNDLIQKLTISGYESVELVSTRGEFTIRGSVIDIFPINSSKPIRINLDGDIVESIRTFNEETQLSEHKVSKYECKASRGFVLDEKSISIFKKNWRSIFPNDGKIFDAVAKGKFTEGIESYFPLFYESKPNFDIFFNDFDIFSYGNIKDSSNSYWKLIEERYEEFISNLDRPPLPPTKLFNEPKEFLEKEIHILIEDKEASSNIELQKKQKLSKNIFEKTSQKVFSQEDQYEFKIDNKVVHSNFGIGVFKGLKNLSNTECFAIEYAEGETLYVPISSMNLLTPYLGNSEIKLDSLSKNNWKLKKEKTRKKAFDIAAELLEAEATRKIDKSIPLIVNANDFEEFSNGFGFQETNDQASVINEVISDLAAEKPQDRLICGEVGFGKTEIALRAAFICAKNKQQVAVLAPTTILARQHYELFKDRFLQTDHEIEFLSREKTQKEKASIFENLKKGKISIIIGTHSLLGAEIEFKDLGLLVIDEEHKFGVRQKEKLRKYSKGINSISLSATPIPRSLNLALSRVRDISIISSPPPGRKAVETLVATYSKTLAKEAMEREFIRSGQVFYLVNNVAQLEEKKKELNQIIPAAKIEIAHGQMSPKSLKEIMVNFSDKKIDILLCTTIIENGLDIANANTLIIEGVENFGLSQLHQIRGRVGRSSRQAYAYFFISPDKSLNKNALARLEALKFSDSLNSGFNLAMRDLEIRGAGEILGEKQSGLIDHVGLSLFSSMINRSIKLLEGFDETHEEFEIKIGENGFIPEAFIPQAEVRLEIYKKFSAIKDLENLKTYIKELEDRFGSLPEDLQILINQTSIRIEANNLLINKIKGDGIKCTLALNENSNLVSKNSKIKEISFNYPKEINSKSEFVLNKLKSFSV